MNRIITNQLLSKAMYQVREMSVHLHRAHSNFLTEKSIDYALRDLKKTQEMLELAKQKYSEINLENVKLK
jgi:hypothetical protein